MYYIEEKQVSSNIDEVDRFLEKAGSSIFQTFEMARVQRETYGEEPHLLVVMNNKQISGVLFYGRRPWAGDDYIVGDGPICSDLTSFKLIMAHFLQEVHDTTDKVSIYTSPFYGHYNHFGQLNELKVSPVFSFVKSLKESKETIWKELHKHARNDVRKSIKEGTQIVEIKDKKLASLQFSRLSQATLQRDDFPSYLPASKNRCKLADAVLKHLAPKNMAKVFFAITPDEEFIGTAMVVKFGALSHLYAVGFDYAFRSYRPMDRLLWHSIEWLKDEGVNAFDLMAVRKEASGSEQKGIYEFKNKWAGRKMEPVEHNLYYHVSPKFYIHALRTQPVLCLRVAVDNFVRRRGLYTGVHLR